jgi:hypothetical protein
MNSGSVIRKSLILGVGDFVSAFAVSTVAQVQTQTSTTTLNNTMWRSRAGSRGRSMGTICSLRCQTAPFAISPMSRKRQSHVDGKQLGIHELQPGMKL